MVKKQFSYVGVGIFFFVLLIIVFCWKEDFDINKTIDSDKVGNFATILGSFATSITIFFLYKQLEEMAESRRASSLPQLYLTKSKYEYCTMDKTIDGPPELEGETGDFPFFRRITDDESGYNYTASSFKSYEFTQAYIELENIGLGTAKDVKISWKFENDKIDALQVRCSESGNFITESLRQVYAYAPDLNAHIDKKIKEVPLIKKDTTIKIDLPINYMRLFGNKIKLRWGSFTTDKILLTLDISYRDIHDKDYNISFNVVGEKFFNEILIHLYKN